MKSNNSDFALGERSRYDALISGWRPDKAEEKRVELHLHTKMSNMDATTDTLEVIRRAAEWGHPAIAITDHAVVQAFPDAADAVKSLGGKIKVIYGAEGYLFNDLEKPDAEDGKASPGARKALRKTSHVTLLAKNETGLKNLYRLITRSHIDDFDWIPIIKKSALIHHREGLLVGSACEAGEVFRAVAIESEDRIIRELAEFYDFLEIMPICNNFFMLGRVKPPMAKSVEDLRGFNRRIVEIGAELGKPVVATGDVHFLDPGHEIHRRIIKASIGYMNIEDEPIFFRTTDEMLREFEYLGAEKAFEVVVTNTRKIADWCEQISPMPPKKLYLPKLEGSSEELSRLVNGRMQELYGENPPGIVTQRVDVEMGLILKHGYDVIYLAAQKLVADSLKQGYHVGSRGGVGSSVVAFLAGITEVNALPAHYRCPSCRYSDFRSGVDHGCGADMPYMLCPSCGALLCKDGFDIPFETFLGPAGEIIPDIDLNFSVDFQAQAHRSLVELFGEDCVFRAGTVGTVREIAALGFVRRYFEYNGTSVPEDIEVLLTEGCIGVKRTTGQHPGGLVVIPHDMEINDFCPVQHPGNDKSKGTITTHFDYKHLADSLMKQDLLSHDDPAMLVMLEEMTGLSASELRLDDPGTLSIFSSASRLGLPEDDDIIGKTGTFGIPEFGSEFARKMLDVIRPKSFGALVRLSGLMHGTGAWFFNASELIGSGAADINEVICFRDDIMQFLISKGMENCDAFIISESVRKGKRIPDGFDEDMAACRLPDWYIVSCGKISYLFPKAHSVAYVMMAFRIAWYKVHKPLEFYSAYFSIRNRKGFFDAENMTRGINAARLKIHEIRNNADAGSKEQELLRTLEVCYEFYLRGFDFTGDGPNEPDPVRFLIEGDRKLRPPRRAEVVAPYNGITND